MTQFTVNIWLTVTLKKNCYQLWLKNTYHMTNDITSFLNGPWNKELGNWTALLSHSQKTPFHSQSDHNLELQQSIHTNVTVSPAVTQVLAHLKFFRQPYPLRLKNNHNIQMRRRLNSRQLRLQPEYLLCTNNYFGTVESPKRENQGTSDLSHTTPNLNRFFVPSLDRVINSKKQQFVVA